MCLHYYTGRSLWWLDFCACLVLYMAMTLSGTFGVCLALLWWVDDTADPVFERNTTHVAYAAIGCWIIFVPMYLLRMRKV